MDNHKPEAGVALHVLEARQQRRERITNLACALMLMHRAAQLDRAPAHLVAQGGAA